ncbi:hypothetical protein [Streptomyces sp. NBC_01750]|uniref:hypothetical protein n=1 Tax=Streptomyces sp. NBC_01750 TaxID=2975928 RepID=UPI002DD7E85F|nr:hypothetical protein [Streptomyces sp. NBC_01750]WSD32204.1 hypothetical protein OG966_09980 [Streptomyces sp. NBC_01750]
MTDRISVRHSDATREYLGDITAATGVTSVSEIVTNSLHLYRDYLRMNPGDPLRVTGHTHG